MRILARARESPRCRAGPAVDNAAAQGDPETCMAKPWLDSYPPNVPHEVDISRYRSVNQLLEE